MIAFNKELTTLVRMVKLRNVLSELSDSLSVCIKLADCKIQQDSLSPIIDLDLKCCRRSLVDMEPTNWKFSFHALELPDIKSIGMDTELMTINPISNPFHYIVNSCLVCFWACV